MYYLWWFVILFRIQVLEEGIGCVILQIVPVAFIHFLFAWWLFQGSSAVYPIVGIGTRSLKLCLPSSLQFLSSSLSPLGQGPAGSCVWWSAPDVNGGASLSVTSGTCPECLHSHGNLEPHTFFSVCRACEGVPLCLSNLEVMSVLWVSETHLEKSPPVLYPASALGHSHKAVSAGGHRAGWSCWCSLALGTLPSWFWGLFAACLACRAACGNLGSITQLLTSSL